MWILLRRRRVLLDGLVWRRLLVLRLHWLWLWCGFVFTEKPSQKAGGFRWLRMLGLRKLLLHLSYLCLGVLQGDVLHKNRLCKDVKRIGVGAQFPAEQVFGIGVFFLELGLVDPLCELDQKLLFLGGHFYFLRQRLAWRASASPD